MTASGADIRKIPQVVEAKVVSDKRPAACVTGAARGIGLAITTALAARGYIVVAVDVDIEPLRVFEHARGPTSIIPFDGDASDRAAIADACALARRHGGQLNVFVANAGISRVDSSLALSRQDWDDVLDLNLTAVFDGCCVAVESMSEGVSIIFVSSILALQGFAGRAAYSAAKAGMLGLMRSLAVEWAPLDVRVNAVLPGFIETDIFQRHEADGVVVRQQLESRIPLRRLGTPEDVAGAVAFLASNEAAYITGLGLTVDGGWTSFGLDLP